MEIVLIVGLFCALIFFTHLSDKNDEKTLKPPSPPPPPPMPKRFVSVIFKEGAAKRYDYFVGNNQDLMINDCVEVPVHSKFTGQTEIKIATVKYVSMPGERSEHAWATVIRRIPNPAPSTVFIPELTTIPTPQSTRPIQPPPIKPIYIPKPLTQEKRFVQVIFKKRGKKRYDYLLGDNNDVRVGDFVVVHVNINGKTTWKIAKVMYISAPGEVSQHAKSAIIKKADYDKW